MTVLVALEGVLRAATGNPIPEGRVLLEAMRVVAPVYILADTQPEEAERWLRLNNVPFDSLVATEVDIGDGDNLRQRQVNLCRSKGRVEFLVDAIPDHIWWAISEGIPSLFFGHPQFAAPISRRDSNRGRRSWEDIETEIDRRQKVAREAVTQEDEQSADL
jgi:hypothetical protein